MNTALEQLKHEKCPKCGSRVTSVSKYSQHSNGYWNESITFDCSSKIEFTPNFMCERVIHPCGKVVKELYMQDVERLIFNAANYSDCRSVNAKGELVLTVPGVYPDNGKFYNKPVPKEDSL